MKCKYCGGRNFMITTKAYNKIEFDKNDEIVYDVIKDYGDMIEEEGYHCLSCERDLKDYELIKEKKEE